LITLINFLVTYEIPPSQAGAVFLLKVVRIMRRSGNKMKGLLMSITGSWGIDLL